MRTKVIIIIFLVLLVLPIYGCGLFDAFRPATIVKHPDAPMLVQKAKGEYVLVSIYDRKRNRLIEYGWIKTNTLEGWTIVKYDWQSFVARRGR